MSNRFTQMGRARALRMYANWSDQIAAGELPTATPARPQGRERNVVDHHVGLGRSEGVPPRRDRDRQAESDGQREWADLRRP